MGTDQGRGGDRPGEGWGQTRGGVGTTMDSVNVCVLPGPFGEGVGGR